MKNTRILVLLFWLSILNVSLFGQHTQVEFPIQMTKNQIGRYTQTIDISDYQMYDFIAFSLVIEGKGLVGESIFGKLITLDSTYEIKAFDEIQYSDKFVSQMINLKISEAGLLTIELTLDNSIKYSDLSGKIRLFSPSPVLISDYKTNDLPNNTLNRSTCECPKPENVARIVWGSSYSLGDNIYIDPPTYTDVSHLIVHHSAGTNISSNWKGVVASIFDFHVFTNGWQDIGYNWLIDPNGVIYEGRGGGDDVRGAHMCGYNNNTMGVCVLGDFTISNPTDKSISSLNSTLLT